MNMTQPKSTIPSELSDLEHVLRSAKVQTLTDVTISASVAAEVIEKWGAGNRRLDTLAVRRYQNDMENRKWQAGTTIGFGVFDNQIQIGDGQHRLHAQVKSSTPQSYTVRVFKDAEDFDLFVRTVDGGKVRSLSDLFTVLEIVGKEPTANAQGITNAMIRFNGLRPSTMSSQEKVAFATNYLKSLKFASGLSRKRFKSHIAAAIALCHNKNSRPVSDFVDEVVVGAGLVHGSPAHVFHMGLSDLNASRDKERAMVLTMRVVYDGIRKKTRSSVKKVRRNSQVLHEVISAFVSKDVADIWVAKMAKEEAGSQDGQEQTT